ncbi:hypothetical protein [Streptomyces sp. AB3(2024)]|uniref:hypothetical protein n=1 Tax=Streptomyces sp. AB3(2024) TaxID=3317321 RepID=UPI0035A307F4
MPGTDNRLSGAPEPQEGVHDLYGARHQADTARETAIGSPGPHAAPYAAMIADGSSDEGDVLIEVLLKDGIVTEVAWAHGDEIPFTLIGGFTSDAPGFVKACTDRWRQGSWLGHPLFAEAEGSLRESLLEAGFTEITTVRSYHWSPLAAVEAELTALLGMQIRCREWRRAGGAELRRPGRVPGSGWDRADTAVSPEVTTPVSCELRA